MTEFAVFLAVVLSVILANVLARYREHLRAEYIRTYMFPKGLFDKFASHHPDLRTKDQQLVARALRQFFLAHLTSKRAFVSMPSQVTDDLWHEFILYTREYQRFCAKAFGKFLHHTPAVVMSSDKQSNAGLRRVWTRACLEENINPRKATRLPLLFALDEKLNVKNGFRYTLDCQGVRAKKANEKDKDKDGSSGSAVYCGSDMSDSSFDGTTDGFGDSGGEGGGDGGGDGGCGGGGCGGD